MLQLRLLGTGQASYGDCPLPGFPHRQPYLLLCYLSLNRQRAHSREQLAAVFWSQYPTNTSRKHLRNAVWRLRRALQAVGAPPDDYIALEDDSVAFRPAGRYWLDVEAFEAAVARHHGIAARDLSPTGAEAMAAAVELYAGDLLEGVYDDWCLYDRERLRLLFLGALGKLMLYHGIHGSYDRALAYGERSLRYDNTREKTHRLMMQLYWLSGQRDRALAQYRLCAEILRDTLGVTPLGGTRRLYQQMLRGQCRPETWPAFEPAPQAAPPAGLQASLAQAADRLRRLDASLAEIRAELQALERLISAGAEDEDENG